MPTKITDHVALITGANRGIGRTLAEALLERGIKKLYATARKPESLSDLAKQYGDRVVTLPLDVTDPEQVRAAAAQATDVTLLVNNAGVLGVTDGLSPEDFENAQKEIEVNYLGVLRMLHAFLPTLKANRATVVNLNSIASFINFPMLNTYSASKAAAHSLTLGLRGLTGDALTVIGVYPGPIETDMTADLDFETTPPAVVADRIIEAIETGDEEVFPDAMAQQLYADWTEDRIAAEKQAAEFGEG